jgi:hypothetical protein
MVVSSLPAQLSQGHLRHETKKYLQHIENKGEKKIETSVTDLQNSRRQLLTNAKTAERASFYWRLKVFVQLVAMGSGQVRF